jgi:CBS domain containing-hemolysin-like protein
MLLIIFVTLLLAFAVVCAIVRPVYSEVPIQELKRRSRRGDGAAHVLYQVARHGLTADIFLLLLTIGASAASFVAIADQGNWLWSTIFIGLMMWLLFVYLPKKQTALGKKLAIKTSPYLAHILVRIRPLSNKVARLFKKNTDTAQTVLYEKEDLIELLKKQKTTAHNRIETTELDLAIHALQFGEKLVQDYMTPRRVVHFVHAEEPIGPILLNELHDSGFSRFPVRKEEDQIVGTLYLKDLVEKRAQGIVSNVMSPDVFYVRGEAPLEQVFAAFLRTKHHLFMVVNEFEEIIGIITIEDVLEQALGRKIVDEFDQYADMRSVARNQARAEDHVDPT